MTTTLVTAQGTGTGWRARTSCSLCGSRCLIRVLALTPTPMANAFIAIDRIEEQQPVFPLDLGRCEDCGHIQLLTVVDRMGMFNRAVDAHGASPSVAAHMRAFAADLLQRFPNAGDALIVDIGSNDGTFLKVFEESGWRVQGIEPAVNVAARAIESGVRTHAGFFTPAIAERIEEERGRASLVTAHMAFAETDDPAALIEGVATLLARNGVFVCEIVYVRDLIERGAFDSITHRVLDYHALAPLMRFLSANDMEIVEVQRTELHRGSLRIFAQRSGGPRPTDVSVIATLADEVAAGLSGAEPLVRLSERCEAMRRETIGRVLSLKAIGATVAGYGATACSTTLLHYLGLDRHVIDYIVDDNVEKHGLYTPGLHIPVRAPTVLDLDERPDWVIVLAWNFASAIIARHWRFREAGGRFLIPLPRMEAV